MGAEFAFNTNYSGGKDRKLDPVGNFYFFVDGVSTGRFAAVDGLSLEVEAIEYRVGGNPLLPLYRQGKVKHGRVVLKRGFVSNPELWNWLTKVGMGTIPRKNLTIQLHDNAGELVAQWDLFNCMPVKWNLSGLDGKGNDVVYESLEFVTERIEMSQG